MARSSGSRILVAIAGALVLLLAALAAVQYGWSTRVAAADAQREKEHLEAAAALFANEFNGLAAQAMRFLQNDGAAGLESGNAAAEVPRLISEVYYLQIPAQGAPEVRRLGADGRFAPAAAPDWITIPRCATGAIDRPPALVAPLYDAVTQENRRPGAMGVLKTFRWRSDRCLVARLDQGYLRDTLLPQLIRQSFGETAVGDYDFAVVPRGRPGDYLYGAALHSDLTQPFLSIPPGAPGPPAAPPAPGRSMMILQHVESTFIGQPGTRLTDLFGPGIWELEIGHKGVPLAAAFEGRRRRDLLLSLGVEVLLGAAILFLVIGARRMQRLADQKMQFVAGVSHELRTPVSAISMLSRNQADGLVAGAEKVKQYGELIHQQCRRLNEMVEQTLQYAGIHSGLRRRASEAIDIGKLIQEAVEARREELARGGFAVEIALAPDLPPAAGDARLLRTAFDNLLSNAQKYADDGRWMRIRAGYAAAEKEVWISVEDRGSGIDPADQAQIFEPFYRGRAAIEAQIPGSGLGLSLVRSAAEAHRGSVTLVSEPGRGSTFTLHLPV